MAKPRIIEAPLGFDLTCTICEFNGDGSLFVKNKSRRHGRINECKECRRERNKKYRNKKIDGKTAPRPVGIYNQSLVKKAKEEPCMDCGNTYPYFVMDLDHVRGEKKFILSQAYNKSTEAVIEEIAKCDVVCANCHRMRTFA